MGDFWVTTLSAIRGGSPDWAAIAAYEAPIRRYLARRFPRLPLAERDDLTQDVLLAMRERIVPRYDADAGPFRAYLTTSIANAVRMHLRRRRPTQPPDLELPAEPSAREVEALDLEARIVRAVRRVHDRYAHGPTQDLQRVYVLSGLLVSRLTNAEIAAREGLSPDQVKRTLQSLRGEVLVALFAELAPDATPSELSQLAELARACLRSPRRERRLLEGQPHAERVAGFTRAVREAKHALGADADEGSVDLLRGIEAIFQ